MRAKFHGEIVEVVKGSQYYVRQEGMTVIILTDGTSLSGEGWWEVEVGPVSVTYGEGHGTAFVHATLVKDEPNPAQIDFLDKVDA